MLDLKTYKSKVHSVEFDDGKVFIKKMSAGIAQDCDELDGADACFAMLAESICDETGKLLYTAEEVKEMENDIVKALFVEIKELNRLKKKAGSVEKK